jgi:TQXA domain-containing protein
MATRLTLARVGAAVLGAAAALTLSALPASAADGTSTVANPNPHGDKYVGSVWLTGHKRENTALIALTPKGGGTDILTYCVEIKVQEGGKTVDMVQVPWTDYPDQKAAFNTNRDTINWILHNSFPTLGVAALSQAAHTPTTLSPQEAVEGTQAAIWHESDGVSLDTKQNDANVDKLYAYLTGSQATLPQPVLNPSVSITPPASTSAVAGDRIGPFTVTTNLKALRLASTVSSGVTVTAVDSQGKTVAAADITNGTKIYFNTSSGVSSGEGSFSVSAPDAQLGELFVGKDVSDAAKKPGGVRQNCKQHGYQSLIVAQSVSVMATGKASWSAKTVTTTTPTGTTTTGTTTPTTGTTTPTVAGTSTTPAPVAGSGAGNGQLPFTGVNLIWPVALAVVLIGGGAAFLLLQRRRKRA